MKLKEFLILNVTFSLEFGALNSHLVHLYGQAAPMWVNIILSDLLIASLCKPQKKCGVTRWVFYIVLYRTVSIKF